MKKGPLNISQAVMWLAVISYFRADGLCDQMLCKNSQMQGYKLTLGFFSAKNALHRIKTRLPLFSL